MKGSPRQASYGPGTYGNDQFAAARAGDFDDHLEKPEGLQATPPQSTRPTRAPKEQRYGRIGGQGKG